MLRINAFHGQCFNQKKSNHIGSLKSQLNVQVKVARNIKGLYLVVEYKTK